MSFTDEYLGTIDPIIEGDTKIHYRWWVQASLVRDTYELRAMRYEERDGYRTASFHLNHEGRWEFVHEGEILPSPTMELSGQLLHVLSQSGLELNRPEIAKRMTDFAARIIFSISARKEEDE